MSPFGLLKLACVCSLLLAWPLAGAEVLIVADEFPAMAALAASLKAEEGIRSSIVAQSNLPPSLAAYSAVLVYIHGDLREPVEKALIRYTRDGGKLVALHHSISSGKRKNKQWFDFLGVSLAQGKVEDGGYKWIESVTLQVVNLAPEHFITTNQVKYPARIAWQDSAAGAAPVLLPGFSLEESEVYLNHKLLGSRTILLGFRYLDLPSGKVYCQNHAGWVRPVDRGWVVYLMPGHSQKDFEAPAYSRIVANAIIWRP